MELSRTCLAWRQIEEHDAGGMRCTVISRTKVLRSFNYAESAAKSKRPFVFAAFFLYWLVSAPWQLLYNRRDQRVQTRRVLRREKERKGFWFTEGLQPVTLSAAQSLFELVGAVTSPRNVFEWIAICCSLTLASSQLLYESTSSHFNSTWQKIWKCP